MTRHQKVPVREYDFSQYREQLLKTFKRVCESTSRTLATSLMKLADQYECSAYDINEYFYIPPRSGVKPKIVLVSHIDTVDDDGLTSKSTVSFSCENGVVRNSHPDKYQKRLVLGADDRAGVAGNLFLMSHFPDVGVLFTHHEESGASGVRTFTDDYENQLKDYIDFSDVRLFVEMDRRGNNHFVDYVGMPDSVKNWIKKYIPNEEYGTFSDVDVTASDLRIPSINVATGFYNEHTSQEHLKVDEWINAVESVATLIKNIDDCPLARIKDEDMAFGGFGGDAWWLKQDKKSPVQEYIRKQFLKKHALPILDSELERIENALTTSTFFKKIVETLTDNAVNKYVDLREIVSKEFNKKG